MQSHIVFGEKNLYSQASIQAKGHSKGELKVSLSQHHCVVSKQKTMPDPQSRDVH